MTLLLPAPTPSDWLATHAKARSVGEPDDPMWVTAADLLAAGAAGLRAVHTRLREQDDVPAVPAAKWVVSWFAGGLADTVGFMLALAAAAPLVELDRARWRLHADGWPEYADPGRVPVVVARTHLWAGLPNTITVADDRKIAARAVAALTTATAAIVDVGRTLARVGRASLWAEIADGLGLPVLHEADLPVDAAAVDRLQLALHAPAAPWRKRPDLRLAATDNGSMYLGRKGGCCLAYQCPPDADPDPESLDEDERAYRDRFPSRPDQPRYCSTCSLRDLGDCEERQKFWLLRERAPG